MARLGVPLAFAGSLLVVSVAHVRGGAVQPSTPQPCATDADLAQARPWKGDLGSGERVCLRLQLERGQFARVRVARAPGSTDYLEATVLAPDDSVPFLRADVEAIPYRALAWEARHTGVHTVVLAAPSGARAVAVTVTDMENPSTLMARRAALATDPRVAWLAEHAISIRTLDPGDTAFADLQPLKPLLSNVRVVLLGEADHGDGSDFLAKSRLIRFLHAEMGFDVLAFEAGVYDMWRAWREIGAGRDPRSSFRQGACYCWAQSEQLGPLVAYVAAAAHSPQPLLLAGVDVQGAGTISGRMAELSDTMVVELATFLSTNGLRGPFANPQSGENQLLKRLRNFAYRPDPDSTALASFERVLAATAGRIEREINTHEGRYWARILRNAASRAASAWPRWPGPRRPYCETDACRNTKDRDPEIVQNVEWLANAQYPGRKIIVWAANAHVMRNPSLTESGGYARYVMADGVRAAFGDQSYAIALVSYEGSYHWASPRQPTFDIIRDQHPEPEFEELMAAAGHRIALVDLRGAVGGNTWLAQPFLARPLNHFTDRSRWVDNCDAFLFLRTQEPSVALLPP